MTSNLSTRCQKLFPRISQQTLTTPVILGGYSLLDLQTQINAARAKFIKQVLVDQDPTNWHIRYWRMEIYKFIRNSNIIGNRYNVRWDQFLIQGHTQLVEAIPDDKNLPPQVKAYLLAWFQVTKDYQPAEKLQWKNEMKKKPQSLFYQPSPITTYELTNGKNPRFFNSRTKRTSLSKQPNQIQHMVKVI